MKSTTPFLSKLPVIAALPPPPPPPLPPPPPPPLPLQPEEEAVDSSPSHYYKSISPVFQLGRSAGRPMSRTVSTSSSSLSECPLESEILKSFADAQELPLFRMEKRASSTDVSKA